MTLFSGAALLVSLCLLLITSGYTVAGFMAAESRLTRLAIASLIGLAWLVLGTSILAAIVPIRGASLGLFACPIVAVWLIPTTRRQLWTDLRGLGQSPSTYAAALGLLLLWSCLLLPFALRPDLVMFDGTANHDSFFWSVDAEYLQSHTYLPANGVNPDLPLFNCVDGMTSLKPAWGRIGAESLLAVTGSALQRSPVQIYNYAVCALALPWLLIVLALARRLGLPRLKSGLLALTCLCQPVLAFFIANGNLPNLLGSLFGGGVWLIALIICASRERPAWPLVIAGVLCCHGMICSYPEIAPFALLPVALLVGVPFLRSPSTRLKPLAWLTLALGGGLLLNPLTTIRAWNGFCFSLNAGRADADWINIFHPLNPAEYLPGLLTLSVSSARIYGYAGGTLATLAVVLGFFLVLKSNPHRWLLLASLAGGFVLLAYTVLTSFSYGWLKTALFSGIPVAVIFPVLLVGRLQATFDDPPARRWWPQVILIGALVVMLHGLLGTITTNLYWSGIKGLTREQFTWRDRVAQEFPGQPVYVDGATFRAPFFHSMWSTFLFARNPLVFGPREVQAGGYLREHIRQASPGPLPATGLYYVAADWAAAFDAQAGVIVRDRVGVLLRQHNLVSAQTGFYPDNGLPEWAGDHFQLTVYPYADGVLEITLSPASSVPIDGTLRGSIATPQGEEPVTATFDARGRLIARFPLKAGLENKLTAAIRPAPVADKSVWPRPGFPFQVTGIRYRPTP